MGSILGKVVKWAASAIALMLFALWGAFHLGVLNAKTSYDCDNMVSEIVALSEKNAAQNGGISLVGIVNKRSISTSATLVECSAKAKWSNATDTGLIYKAYVEDGQWWLQYNAN